MADVRVLVVDDQAAYRRALAAVVTETDGFVVVAETTSGEESLAVAAEMRPDLVLMDVNLPGISGIDAARRLTAAPGGPVVVLLSTYDEDEFDLEGCGASAYVAKAAFGPDRLAEVWSADVRASCGTSSSASAGMRITSSSRRRVLIAPPTASARSRIAWRSASSWRAPRRTITTSCSSRQRSMAGHVDELARGTDAGRSTPPPPPGAGTADPATRRVDAQRPGQPAAGEV